MEGFTVFLHGVSVGLLALTSAALARPGAGKAVRTWGAIFAAGVAGYIIRRDIGGHCELGALNMLVWALSVTSSGFFLLFARALLRDTPSHAPESLRRDQLGLGALGAFSLFGLLGTLVPRPEAAIFWAMHQALEFVVYGYALWLAVGGWRNDLVEDRRAVRGPLVAVITVYGLLQGAFETASFFAPESPAYVVGEAAALAAVCFGIPLFILQTRWDRLAATRRAAPAPAPNETTVETLVDSPLSAADRIELKRVLELVDGAGAYREEGLSIGVLADRVSIPEHRLRRLINQGLGYRNYAAFLNDRRIEAAKSILQDPAKARTPVLTIALDLGYGSVGPFNRAFKEATGMTPTAYRAFELSPEPE